MQSSVRKKMHIYGISQNTLSFHGVNFVVTEASIVIMSCQNP